jgi:hypothetical protein
MKPAEGLTPREKRKGHRSNPLKAWSRSGSKKEKQAIADGTIPPKHRRDGAKDSLIAVQHELHGKLHRKVHGGKPIGK